MPVLLHQQNFAGIIHRQDCYRTRVVDIVAHQLVAVFAELETVADNVPDAAFVHLPGRQKTARARRIRNLPCSIGGFRHTGHRAVL
ncbi:hypothetical protein D9M72_600140 [compost metagenome]